MNTLETGTFTDPRDGKIYTTVVIGAHTWMSQNLNFEGTGYCYNNLAANGLLYGRLYTHDQTPMAIPEGWRLPSKEEVGEMYALLGGINVAGAKLKKQFVWEPYASHTNPPSTNTSGFTAVQTGTRWNTGAYKLLSPTGVSSGLWWTSTEVTLNNSAYYFGVGSYMANAKLGEFYIDQAIGIRCVKI